jgi:hypothetical protein
LKGVPPVEGFLFFIPLFCGRVCACWRDLSNPTLLAGYAKGADWVYDLASTATPRIGCSDTTVS